MLQLALLALIAAGNPDKDKDKDRKKDKEKPVASSQPAAEAKVSIHPKKRRPGKRFLIVDTGGRLLDKSKAIFTQGANVVEIELKEGKRHKAAVGKLPDTIAGGKYKVSVKTTATTFDVGEFEVKAPVTPPAPEEDPDIEPMIGGPGTTFTITDPKGRIVAGDNAFFYPVGGSSVNATPAKDPVVGADNKSLKGAVPSSLEPNTFSVGVKPSAAGDSRFSELTFVLEI